tara:strand:+ start:351 stop:572 length:222 start_codon:yes stop_codon:yes gene_type:complete
MTKTGTNQNKVVMDAMGLSSGTIATLMNKAGKSVTNYWTIDRIQADFIRFIQNSVQPHENWATAWNEFIEKEI